MSMIDPDLRAPGVDDALETMARLDAALLHGLSRLAGAERDAVEGLGGLFVGTPLSGVIERSLEGIRRGTPTEHDARAFAAARASIDGALHDALLDAACTALGRTRPTDHPTAAPVPLSDEDEAPLRNARHWLLELSTAGLAQVSTDAIGPFASTLETLAERPRLHRPTAILTGFFDELAQALPLAQKDDAPSPRWPELWTRCMLAAGAPSLEAREPIAGTFAPLGAEVRHHDHAMSVAVYGVIDGAILRATFTGWKVDALLGAEALRTLPEPASVILEAIAGDRTVAIRGTKVGDDVIIDEAKLGAAHAPYEIAIDQMRFPVARPFDRHPVQIAIPVALPECAIRVEGETRFIDPLGVRVADERISPLYEVKSGSFEGATSAIGLLRWDGRWAFQPLDARVKKARWGLSEAIAEAAKPEKATDAIGVLRERAGKLLRSK